MSAFALIDALPDFGKRGSHAGPVPAAMRTTPPEPDAASLVEARIALAEAAVADHLGKEYEAALAAEREAHAVELARLSETLGQQAGQLIDARFEEMERQIADMVSTTAARILGSVLSDDLQKRALKSLADSIRDAVRDREAVRIRVRGPRSLFEGLTASLGAARARVDFTEEPGFDLVAQIDGSLIETRMGEWAAALEKVLA
jgi:hypothetical protein